MERYWQVVVTYQFRTGADRITVTSALFTNRAAAIAAVEAGIGERISFTDEPDGRMSYYPSAAPGFEYVPGIWFIVIEPVGIDDTGKLVIATLKTCIEDACSDDERRQARSGE